ncbi:MAG: hypothetical protein K1V84_01090 [Muribaculaceae bacterium]
MKRLIRTYLRRQLATLRGFAMMRPDEIDKQIGWVLHSPVRQWPLRYWCVRQTPALDHAQRLYDWLIS